MPPVERLPAVSTAFIALTFAVAITVGVAIVYLGVTGQIGTGIP